MPRGSEHRLTGLLVADLGGFALEVDGGGRWRLDVADYAAASRLLNRRVALAGRRCGFDQLEVDAIALV
jgi:hypothetical protein